ncbi:MAG: acyl carrier protein [Hydrogenophaga sp.]|uniref:COG4648 family protein n=1 Tax=Hydrogenophaga sp. TaxID=1904254 RepID=UPI002631211D|nr:acyl carrier protein [Hydrogenophaga sp.]MCV0441094.1 acyl carrier protein [Hydrogenophaga sp.]
MKLPSVLRDLGVLLLMVAWVVAAHVGSAGWGNPDFNAAVAVLPIGAAVLMALWRLPQRVVRAAGVLALAVALAWLWPRLRLNVPLMYYLQHLGIHVALGVYFGKSLLGPGEALITRMARRIFSHELSARKLRYTRGVTLAWTLFFFTNALVSTLLFLWAPPAIWSVHANLLTGPLIGLMFVIEHVCRLFLLPPHERPGIAAIVQAYKRESAQRGGGSAGSSQP